MEHEYCYTCDESRDSGAYCSECGDELGPELPYEGDVYLHEGDSDSVVKNHDFNFLPQGSDSELVIRNMLYEVKLTIRIDADKNVTILAVNDKPVEH